ncbi:YihY/virulence factor BrkB family protein [Rhodocaloribacter litoris]|uniref:YihY/virulence factor BrkB family protein n=1 Tax=Rhodocaloribacter litoris TaxID=2558931 RepID=UPI00141DEFF3|nr:YihY/virulence factor BrkB family protein [Rhodocaloribacter litoris]QXD14516.1 YihY/virulence factor BrkB family protein [Rhodocaloribacter litoris]
MKEFLVRLTPAPVRYYLGGLYRLLDDKDVFLWAQAIAFKVLVTLVPLVLLGTGILALMLRQDAPLETAFEAISRLVRDFLPPPQSWQIITFLQQFLAVGGTLTFIGAVALFLSAMTLFSTVRTVLANVFREEWHDHRSILRGYLFDMRMVVQVGIFFILSLALTFGLQALNAAGADFLQQVGLDYVWLRTGWRRLFNALGLVLPFVLSTAVFFQLIYFNPKPHPPVRSALLGATVAALLWEVVKVAFAVYATKVGRFGGVGIAAGTFGLIIALVFWAYYSGLVFIIGALVTLLHEKRHRLGGRPEAPPEPDAVSGERMDTTTVTEPSPEKHLSPR